MQDRKEYNEQLDDFSRLVKQKLEGHRIPVDADSWTEIERRLQPRAQKRRLWWMAGAAAAVAVLVSVFLIRPQDEIGVQSVTDGQIQQPVEQVKPIASQPMQDQTKQSAVLVPENGKRPARSVRLLSGNIDSVKTSHGVTAVTGIEKSLSTESPKQETSNPLSKTIADAGSGTSISDSVPATVKTDAKRKDEPKLWLAEKKTKKQKSWLLAAGFSSNGNMSGNGKDALPGNAASLISKELTVDMQFASLMKTEDPFDLNNADHDLPLSFGFSVRKNITDRIGIETGLVYTYLSSRFGSVSFDARVTEAKQELHYLGVPLNVVVSLWNNPKWNLYVSAGGMGEKGLRRKYTYMQNSTTQSIKEGISGLQWSMNASLGISYRVYKDWGLYFEPRYSHYFDNNQPRSIRTDKKDVFGFTAGLRFEF